jgi:hypothetical protein
MLEGFDKDWVNAGKRRIAGYANYRVVITPLK